MSSQIVRIEIAGPGSRARRLVFDGEAQPRLTSAAAVKHLGLEVGAAIDPAALEQALEEIEYPLAKDRALMLLGYREHSSAELRRKLTDVGYPVSVARAVVERFGEVELVSDERFAAAWVRSRRLAGYGTRRIARELEQKGIAPEIVRAALDEEAEDAGSEVQRAKAALRGRTADDPKSRDKLLRRLVSRGFSLGVALKALELDESDASEE